MSEASTEEEMEVRSMRLVLVLTGLDLTQICNRQDCNLYGTPEEAWGSILDSDNDLDSTTMARSLFVFKMRVGGADVM